MACITIVGIPFGMAAFRIGWFILWPFGRTTVPDPNAGPPSAIGDILWFVFFGWWLALGHVATAIAQAVTIIGIPLALGNLKILPVTMLPLGKIIVPVDAVHTGAFSPVSPANGWNPPTPR